MCTFYVLVGKIDGQHILYQGFAGKPGMQPVSVYRRMIADIQGQLIFDKERGDITYAAADLQGLSLYIRSDGSEHPFIERVGFTERF
jgi:hypothetical protein